MSNDKATSRAARAMGKRSVEVRKEAWGEEEFLKRMREIGKLGGRPRKDGSAPSQTSAAVSKRKRP